MRHEGSRDHMKWERGVRYQNAMFLGRATPACPGDRALGALADWTWWSIFLAQMKHSPMFSPNTDAGHTAKGLVNM